jgi:hypothetical protein
MSTFQMAWPLLVASAPPAHRWVTWIGDEQVEHILDRVSKPRWDIVERLVGGSGLGFPVQLIAATAEHHGALWTRNVQHFPPFPLVGGDLRAVSAPRLRSSAYADRLRSHSSVDIVDHATERRLARL